MKTPEQFPSLVQYCGTHDETGWHRMRVDGQAVFAIGTLEVIPELVGQVEKKVRGLLVRCDTSAKAFRFVGALLPTPKSVAMQVLTGLVNESLKANFSKPSEQSAVASVAGVKNLERDWFDKELIRIQAMRGAGVDPYVGMRFLVPYLGESRPSLSRKFGKELSVPAKRGGRNFWLLSQIDSYAAGKAFT